MVKDNLNRKLDDVLERLQFLRMVISNLKDRSGTAITDVGDINERLFKEISSYEMSTEELKKDFVMLMVEDAKRLADACTSNTDILDKTNDAFDKINETLDFIKDHEDQDIKKSKELQDFVVDSGEQLKDIRKGMNSKVRAKQDEIKDYEKTQEMHSKIHGGG